ncbi:MAG TPA: hypothetical protein VFK87_08275 [Steroidobacteraceae bacterium]|nr:hypothetical protein [Steroidobacteraceae bacterium]
MRAIHAPSLLAWAAAAATLGGCASGLRAEAPAGATLAGTWKLDRAASDDPQKIIARMRAEAVKLIGRRTVSPPPAGGARGAASPVPPPEETGGALGDEPGGAHGRGAPPDPLRRSPMMHALARALARGEFLTVRQSPEAFVLDYGTTVRSFTPGAHSVVSAEQGVADQISGWSGREYVIEARAQIGPNVVERYALSRDGRQLIETLRIGPAELPAVELKRVYEHTDEAAPHALPTSD